MDIKVKIAQDYSSAFLTVLVEEYEERKVKLQIQDLEKALSDSGVVVGIRKNVLENIVNNRTFNKQFSVAVWKPPGVGDDARVEILKKPKRFDEVKPVKTKEDEIDYVSPREGLITYARKNELLAIKYPPKRGKPGTSVLGKTIPGKLGKEIPLDLFQGVNTRIEGNKLYAEKEGIISLEGIKIHIKPRFVINDNIGMNTGSIDLPLDLEAEIVVNGDVQRGFSVVCNNLSVSGCIEDAKVITKILFVKAGIVGNGDDLIITERLNTSFINGQREVRANIVQVLHEISSGAKVFADVVKAYTIQGSTVYAKHAIWTDYLNGNNYIYVGIDFNKKQEYDRLGKALIEIQEPLEELKEASYANAKKMKQLRELYKVNPKHTLIQKELPRIKELNNKLAELEQKQEKLQKQREETKAKMYPYGDAFLLVRSGFAKDDSAGIPVEPNTLIYLKDESTKVIESVRGGLFTYTEDGINQSIRYNIKEYKYKLDKFLHPVIAKPKEETPLKEKEPTKENNQSEKKITEGKSEKPAKKNNTLKK